MNQMMNYQSYIYYLFFLQDLIHFLLLADYFLKTGQAGEEVLEHVVIDLCRGTA